MKPRNIYRRARQATQAFSNGRREAILAEQAEEIRQPEGELVYMGLESAFCEPYLVATLQEWGLIHRKGFGDEEGLLVMTPGTTPDQVWAEIAAWVA